MSGMFGGGGNSTQVQMYTGIQVSTSMYGTAIPLVYGTQRLPFNLIWYGSFSSHGQSAGGKGGGKGASSYTYTTAFAAALCMGQIDSVRTVWWDKALTNLTNQNLALSLGGTAPATWSYLTTYTPASVNFTASISGNQMTVTGIGSGGGALQLGMVLTGGSIAAGTTITDLGTTGGGVGVATVSISQTLGSTSLTGSMGATGSQAVPYADIAYVATSNYELGGSANMPNLTFEVAALKPYSVSHGMLDADPSDVLPDYLTDPIHGAGFPGTIQNLKGSTNTWQAYVMAAGLLTSPYENNQREATSFLTELMQCTNSDIVLSVGTLKVFTYTDVAVSGTTPDGSSWSYTPNLTPLFSFTDSDYVPKSMGDPPVKLVRTAQASTYNVVNVEYLDRANYYNTATVTQMDQNDIDTSGSQRVMSSVALHQITNVATASTVAQLILLKSLYDRNTYEFTVRPDYMLLEPGDLIALTDSYLGLNGQVCRVMEVSITDAFEVQIKALEVPGTTRSTPTYNWNAAQGYLANYATAPGSVQAPQIFQMPPIPQAINEGLSIGVAVCGPSANPYWGGCYVYLSLDGGTTYANMGPVGTEGQGKYGTLTSGLANGSDPDTTHTISVQLANTTLQLDSGTHADADAMMLLALIDTGNNAEVVSYATATLGSPGAYNITYLRRGKFGSNNTTHANGVRFVRLDGSIFQIALDPGWAGQTLWFKFTSYNTWGKAVEDISAVTAYSYTVPQTVVNGDGRLQARGLALQTTAGGMQVFKPANGGAWNADCVSAEAFVGGCTIAAQYLAGGALAVGLVTSTGSTLQPIVNMDYGIYAHADSSQTNIVEGGSIVATLATPAVGDRYWIVYDNYYVRYYINGILAHQTYAPGKALYAGLAIYSSPGAFGSVSFDTLAAATPYAWLVTGTVAGNTTGFAKPTGSNAWDSCAYSIDGYPACHIAGKVNGAAQHLMIGLSSTPTASSSYTNANYAWYSDGVHWTIYESGSAVATFSAVATSDQVAITYDGTNVKYYLNTVLQRTVAVSSLTLFGFIPINDVGAGCNAVLWGPTTSLDINDTYQIGANAASQALSATNAGPQNYNISSAVDADVLTVSGTFLGVPVGIDITTTIFVSLEHYTLNSPTEVYITRDGTQIGTAIFDIYSYVTNTTASGGPVVFWVMQATLTVMDTPSAGSHTYAMHVHGVAATNSGSPVQSNIQFNNSVLKVREYKR